MTMPSAVATSKEQHRLLVLLAIVVGIFAFSLAYNTQAHAATPPTKHAKIVKTSHHAATRPTGWTWDDGAKMLAHHTASNTTGHATVIMPTGWTWDDGVGRALSAAPTGTSVDAT